MLLVTEKFLKSRLQLSFKLSQRVLRNCILRAYDAAAALNAVMIELFIHGIISLAFLPLASSSRLLFRFSQSLSTVLISLPKYFISYISSLRRIVAFCNFPYVSALRISCHADCASLRYFRDVTD